MVAQVTDPELFSDVEHGGEKTSQHAEEDVTSSVGSLSYICRWTDSL